MKPSMVALLSAVLLWGGWAVHDTANARETDWWFDEEVTSTPDATPEPLDEFQAAIPAETGSLPPGNVSGSGSAEEAGPSAGQPIDPDE